MVITHASQPSPWAKRTKSASCLAGGPPPLMTYRTGRPRTSATTISSGTQLAATIADSNLSGRDVGNGSDQVRGLFSDNVFVFEGHGRRVAVIAEVQTGRPDTGRSLSWPAYVANARHRHRCDALLMVFAITKDAARASAKAIRTGHPGWDLIPLVSGVGKIPGLPGEDTRFGAELVLLRIITRELTLSTHDACMFALAAVQSAPPARIARYTGYLKALVSPPVREHLEALMKPSTRCWPPASSLPGRSRITR